MTGWMRRKPLVSALLLICAAPMQAAEQGTVTEHVDEEFLMFLADWEDEQGNWQDPLDYEDQKWAELDNKQVTDDESTDSD